MELHQLQNKMLHTQMGLDTKTDWLTTNDIEIIMGKLSQCLIKHHAKTYQFFYNASLEEVTHEENNKQ
jgi:hypothetical protein